MFADPTGRRAWAMSGLGLGIVSAALIALGIVVTGAVGFGRLPLLSPLIAGRAPARPPLTLAALRHDTDGRSLVLLARLHPSDRDDPASAHPTPGLRPSHAASRVGV